MISVIVPVYNVENYLDRCIQSIVDQTYNDLEIILVDDGSSDNCPEMCDDWALKDRRIKVIHKENGGLSDARNAGMEIATGQYIGFVDSDDWIAPEMYEKLYDSLLQEHSDIAACSVEVVWKEGSPGKLLTQNISEVLTRYQAQEALLAESKLKQPVWYKLYRSDIIKDIRFEKGKYHEDVFWSYQAIGNANKVSIIDFVGYYYWQRKGSIMGEGYTVKRIDGVEAKIRRQEYIEQYMPDLALKGRINLLFTCMYHGQLAIQQLEEKDQELVLAFLNATVRMYKIGRSDLKGVSRIHKLWLCLLDFSFVGTCRLRNKLKVGF